MKRLIPFNLALLSCIASAFSQPFNPLPVNRGPVVNWVTITNVVTVRKTGGLPLPAPSTINPVKVVIQPAGSGSSNLNAKTLDWANRVVANGGLRPSNTVLQLYNIWYTTIVSNSIDSLIIANVWLNAVPGTVIANITPFFHTFGTDPWGQGIQIVSGDFTINGLVGVSQSNKYLTTGVIPSVAFPSVNSAGLAIYCYDDNGTHGGWYAGCNDSSNANLYESPLYNGGGSGLFFTCFFGGSDFINWLAPDVNNTFHGWISSQRTSANSWNIYGARSNISHASVGSSINAPGSLTSHDIYILTKNDNGVPVAGNLGKDATISFVIITQGLTSSQDNILFNATQTLLVSSGGGFR